jgi:hypothetical protein
MERDKANGGRTDLLDAAVQIWRKAQIVCNPSRAGSPSEAMVGTIANQVGKYRERLVQCLSHESQLVAAYALVFEKTNDPVLSELSTEVLNRHDKITIVRGSFSEKMELGAFARMLQKEARRRQAV